MAEMENGADCSAPFCRSALRVLRSAMAMRPLLLLRSTVLGLLRACARTVHRPIALLMRRMRLRRRTLARWLRRSLSLTRLLIATLLITRGAIALLPTARL
ncbi:MAG TPA: hypothetical protein VHY80_00120, partial [Stellaceae bacterium]|nr:hypothetical protein [Stellaceae bacterium]